jgi:hypothetical protein
MLPVVPRSPKQYLLFGNSDQNLASFSHLSHACHKPNPSHPPWFVTLIILQ